jgi:hypothetical protein
MVPLPKIFPYNLQAKTVILHQEKLFVTLQEVCRHFWKTPCRAFCETLIYCPTALISIHLIIVFGVVKESPNKYGLISNFDRLAEILKKEWEAIPQQVIRDSIESWTYRVCKVEKTACGHIE